MAISSKNLTLMDSNKRTSWSGPDIGVDPENFSQ
jgi:hypothetical protein